MSSRTPGRKSKGACAASRRLSSASSQPCSVRHQWLRLRRRSAISVSFIARFYSPPPKTDSFLEELRQNALCFWKRCSKKHGYFGDLLISQGLQGSVVPTEPPQAPLAPWPPPRQASRHHRGVDPGDPRACARCP